MPRWLVNALMLVIVVLVPPLLLFSNLYILLTPQYLAFEYDKPDFPKSVRFSERDRRYYATESVEYERGNRNFEQFLALGVYNERELNHMVDVRVYFGEIGVFEPLGVLLLLLALAVLGTRQETRALAARAVLSGALLTLAIFVLVGLFAATAFNTFFTQFHYLFFEGESGFFNYSDSLIQFYPERFWSDTFLTLIAVTVVDALIVAAIGWLWGRSMIARRPVIEPDTQQA